MPPSRIFLNRFLDEMTHVVGRKEDLILNFLAMMESLFGKAEADRMEAAIRQNPRWTR